ncbi:MAG: hypothetical protein LBE82_11030, partial [Chitinophagaceae bacterium]|nr:hypothetical protein [Chitinophagaceae bacterium]
MKQNNITASITPDKRFIKKNGMLPLKLRITYKGERKYYATGYEKKALTLSEIQTKAQRCGDELENFSFAKFETAFFSEKVVTQSV